MPHFIFIQQISVLNILNMLYNLHFFSLKCRLFHNVTLFGFCITHILNTGCAKIWRKKSVAKRLMWLLNPAVCIAWNSCGESVAVGPQSRAWSCLDVMRCHEEAVWAKYWLHCSFTVQWNVWNLADVITNCPVVSSYKRDDKGSESRWYRSECVNMWGH